MPETKFQISFADLAQHPRFIIRDKERLEQIIAYAKTLNSRSKESLRASLERLTNLYGGHSFVELCHDFAPHSMGFALYATDPRLFPIQEPKLVGGLIFHGPTSGSAPNFSVEVGGPEFPHWSLHT